MPVLDLIRCVFFLFTKLISVIPQTRPEKKNLINIFIVLVLVKKMVRNWKKKKKSPAGELLPPNRDFSLFWVFFFNESFEIDTISRVFVLPIFPPSTSRTHSKEKPQQ